MDLDTSLTPPRGRPKKDPEERRSEIVHIRVRPSYKKLIKQEASRRDASITLIVVRVGFEEMNPSGRLLPEPRVWRWMLDQASDCRDAANDSSRTSPRFAIRDFEMRDKADEVEERHEERKALVEGAKDERRTETIGVRLKPRRFRWLGERAEQLGTSRSGLLRARALEGIAARDKMEKTVDVLWECIRQANDINRGARNEKVTEGELRKDLRDFASQIESKVGQLREP